MHKYMYNHGNFPLYYTVCNSTYKVEFLKQQINVNFTFSENQFRFFLRTSLKILPNAPRLAGRSEGLSTVSGSCRIEFVLHDEPLALFPLSEGLPSIGTWGNEDRNPGLDSNPSVALGESLLWIFVGNTEGLDLRLGSGLSSEPVFCCKSDPDW